MHPMQRRLGPVHRLSHETESQNLHLAEKRGHNAQLPTLFDGDFRTVSLAPLCCFPSMIIASGSDRRYLTFSTHTACTQCASA